MYESGNFVFAYPNIICKAELFSTFPNDPYFQFQITCHNTGQTYNGHSGTSDADIDAPEAWDITTGNNNIIIAVFDEGVTSDHPDLPNTRQVRLNGSNYGSGDANNPSPTGDDNHGNSCAGVIGATMNNNEGIAGIAPNCRIMPLRFDGTTTSDEMADGIEFAVDNGANIISNSWGYRTSNNNYIPAIVTAIQYAINNNVVVVFAAGNEARHSCSDNGYVAFPANASVNGLLSVGASDRFDNQADYSPTSSLIDIVAPSHRAYPPEAYSPNCGGISGETVEMWTLDIPGVAGYNTWPATNYHPPATGETLPNTGTNYLSYTGRFGGTSHSCPVVAGVAALILSINPLLTPQDMYNVLTGTADKIGSYSYTNGRCNETGYGRVNAFNALLAVSPEINGHSFLCTTAKTYILDMLAQSSYQVSWTATPSWLFTSSSGTGDSFTTAWAGGVRSGLGTITATLTSECDPIIVSTTTWLGKPQTPTGFCCTTGEPLCIGNQYYHQFGTTGENPGAESYEWIIDSPGVILGSSTGRQVNFYFPNGTTPGWYTLSCRAVNSCGGSSYYNHDFYADNCGLKGFSFTTYPNPANDILTIEMQPDEGVTLNDGVNTKIEIFDINMMPKNSITFAGNSTGINVSNLPNGIYILKISIDEEKCTVTSTSEELRKELQGNKVYFEKVQIQH